MIHISSIINKFETIRYWVETGILFDIEDLGSIDRCIAKRETPSEQEIRPGIWLKKDCHSFTEGNFTNIYDLYWDPNQSDIVPEIYSSNTPYYLADTFEKDPSITAAINGGFFFLTDVPGKEPQDYRYNFCIDEGEFIGLPIVDDPIVYIRDGKLFTQATKAHGICKIGENEIHWFGVKSSLNNKENQNPILYNSKCIEIIRYRDPLNNLVVGKIDEKDTTTPKNDAIFDILVNENEDKQLIISKINNGGGTHYFDALFIFQLNKKEIGKYKVGDQVKPISIDSIEMEGITSGMTIGKSVDSPYFLDPVRVDRQDVRSVIAQDIKGFLHFFVFDANKYVPGFKGVSGKDLTSFFSKDKYAWAYFLDGGGSARIIARYDGKLEHMGNRYGYQKLPESRILWNWKKARKIYSSISLRTRSK